MASIATYSGVVRDGKVDLCDKIKLPEGTEVLIVVPTAIDERTARRKANGWLVSYVGNMLMADDAALINLDGKLLWHLSAYITGLTHEPVGPIGNVFINALTGDILQPDQTAQNLRDYGKRVDRSILSPAS
ncbi:MAG: hypothetical protein U0350_38030 [Caldilineaceae bacterium]